MAKTWTTQDGKTIQICNMEDDHIVNCIKMLERQEDTVISGLINPVQKFGYVEVDRKIFVDIEEAFDWYDQCDWGVNYRGGAYFDLVEEAKSRGLSI